MTMAATVLCAQVAAQDQKLVQLHQQLGMNYLEPAPHMALAKYLWERGDRLQAFHILENARRNRFPRPQFDAAFARAFARRLATEAGVPLFNRAIQLQQAGNLAAAEESFLKAAELSPGSVQIQSWVARFLYKVRKKDEPALNYYLNAYFLDPHAYESEFVESRIRTINYEAASIRYRWLSQKDASIAEILSDPNPTVVVLALEALEERWSAAYLEPVIKCLEHEDEVVRWLATGLITKNVDRSFDERLKQLLKSNDLRIRGLAAYIAVKVWKQESFPAMRQMLREPAQLLRFDAISALAMHCGTEGRQILFEHQRRETNPTLLKLIDNARQ
jgi:tetratricopeptide (TPR) repeat protein